MGKAVDAKEDADPAGSVTGSAAGRRTVPRILAAMIAVALTSAGAAADGLPEIGGLGTIAGLGLPPELAQAGAGFAAAALANLIRDGAAEAGRNGLARMPQGIRARMAGRFPDAVLREVRWAVAPADTSIRRIVFEIGDAAAVTLGRVVLFDDAAAAADATLWAHELTHVMQYERWGIDGFARRYVADRRGVEAEAEQAARDVATGSGAGIGTAAPRERRPVQRPYRWDG